MLQDLKSKVREVFRNVPPLHEIELRKYAAGFADGTGYGPQLSEEYDPERFSHSVELIYWGTPTVIVRVLGSVLFDLCRVGLDEPLPPYTINSLVLCIEALARAEHINLDLIMLSDAQIETCDAVCAAVLQQLPTLSDRTLTKTLHAPLQSFAKTFSDVLRMQFLLANYHVTDSQK